MVEPNAIRTGAGVACAAFLTLSAVPARADSFLAGLHRHPTLTSTITDNGDLNPYAVVIAPV